MVGIITITAAVQVLRAARSWSSLRVLMYYAPVLVIAQIVLGIFTVLTFRAIPIAVAHFAGATALWGLWMSAWFLTSTKIRRAVVVETRPASFARTTAVAR